jgi:hypothetical protein
MFLALLVLVPNFSYAQTETINVRYGRASTLDMDAYINRLDTVDVHVQTGSNHVVGDIHFVLGTNDQYIDAVFFDTLGVLYPPLTQWRSIIYSEKFGSPPNAEGWSSQAVYGWSRFTEDDTNPWLYTESFTHIASFIIKTANDSLNIGDRAAAIGFGITPIQGESNAGDTVGGLGFIVHEEFSHFNFVGGGFIEGHITDHDNNPVEGISVVCQETGKEVFSDETGFYHMGHYPGSFNFTFSHPDYISAETAQDITLDQTVNHDVTLDMYGVISGTVSDYEGSAISGVEVSTGSIISITGDDGVYSLTGLAAGSYDVEFSHPDYVDVTETGVSADLNTTTPLDMTLHQIAGIQGIVTDTDTGDPLGGIIVSLVEGTQVDTTNANGYYTLDGIAPGDAYSVLFDDPTGAYDDSTLTNVVVAYDVNTQLDIGLREHTGIDNNGLLPGVFALNQNYPNPFNAKTIIEYSIDKDSHVKLDVFDVLGRKVANLVDQQQNAGVYKATLNASALTSGMYFYRLQADDKIEQKSMMLLK